jgi:putative molybdopterin biosynthesis protein
MAGCHLFDPDAKEYNLSYVRHFFPDRTVHVLTLAHRLQGLLIQSGNPYAVQGLEDLNRDDLIFINRKEGSGTRLWLDQQLGQIKINPKEIRGYENAVNTHSMVAEAILSGKAQVGLGVLAAAQECGLSFIPLFQERFDLVILDEAFQSQLLSPVLDYLQTAKYRHTIESLGGYDLNDTGKLIQI